MQSHLRLLGVVLALSVVLFLACLRFSIISPLQVLSCPQTLHIEYHTEEVVSETTEEPDEYPEEVLTAFGLRSGLRGFQTKKGILNPVQWRPEYKEKRQHEALHWLHTSPSGKDHLQPPWQYPGCLVHINHHYKFIWIKGKKVGGTTIRKPLRWICDDFWQVPYNANKTYCSEKLHKNTVMSLDEAKEYWKEYFVFAFTRNPYSRFASSYTYINGITSFNVSFEDTCREPFVHAKITSVTGGNRYHYTQHHIHHMMEQGSCFFTKSAELAVDFVGETENLMGDLEIILDEINRRKPADLPPLKIGRDELPKRNSNKQDSYALELFATQPQCLGNVEKHFWRDFEGLKYSNKTTVAPSTRSEGSPSRTARSVL